MRNDRSARGGARKTAAKGATAETISSRRQATRTRLLDATRDVMAAKGVHGASVEEICEKAGFTRGAFYSNYADKGELLLDVARREQARIFDPVDVDKVTGDLDSTVDALLATQRPDLAYHLLRTEIGLHALRTPDFAPVALAVDQAFRDGLVQILTVGLARLGLEPIGAVDDIADCVAAVSEHSIRTAALRRENDHLAQARRVLPAVIRSLTRPVGSE